MARRRPAEAPDVPTVDEIRSAGTVAELVAAQHAIDLLGGGRWDATWPQHQAVVRRLVELAEQDHVVLAEVVALARRFDPRGGPHRFEPPPAGSVDATRAGLVRALWRDALRLYDDGGSGPGGVFAVLHDPATFGEDPDE